MTPFHKSLFMCATFIFFFEKSQSLICSCNGRKGSCSQNGTCTTKDGVCKAKLNLTEELRWCHPKEQPEIEEYVIKDGTIFEASITCSRLLCNRVSFKSNIQRNWQPPFRKSNRVLKCKSSWKGKCFASRYCYWKRSEKPSYSTKFGCDSNETYGPAFDLIILKTTDSDELKCGQNFCNTEAKFHKYWYKYAGNLTSNESIGRTPSPVTAKDASTLKMKNLHFGLTVAAVLLLMIPLATVLALCLFRTFTGGRGYLSKKLNNRYKKKYFFLGDVLRNPDYMSAIKGRKIIEKQLASEAASDTNISVSSETDVTLTTMTTTELITAKDDTAIDTYGREIESLSDQDTTSTEFESAQSTTDTAKTQGNTNKQPPPETANCISSEQEVAGEGRVDRSVTTKDTQSLTN